jgi:hypothetical protein
MSALRTTALLAFACSLVACSSAAPGPEDEETPAAQAPAPLVAPKDPCPKSAPRAGSTCSDASLLCSYGTDPRFGCRDILACDSGTWTAVGDACSKTEPTCPRTAPKPEDGGVDTCSSADLGLSCVYAHEAYTCAPCQGNLCFTSNRWLTQSLPTACPATVPNFGQACTAPSGTRCNYNTCASDGADDLGAAVTCTGGFWMQATGTICL